VREALALLVELLAGDLAQEQRHLVLVQAGEIETGDALLAGDIGEEGLEVMRLPELGCAVRANAHHVSEHHRHSPNLGTVASHTLS
jgi:hypothetical protein